MPFRYEDEMNMGLNPLPECVVELGGGLNRTKNSFVTWSKGQFPSLDGEGAEGGWGDLSFTPEEGSL